MVRFITYQTFLTLNNFEGNQHREKNPRPSISYQGKNRGDYPTMEKNSAVDENIEEYPAVDKYPVIKNRAEYLPIEKNSVTGKDKDAEEYIEEEGYIRESAPRKRYPTMMNSNDRYQHKGAFKSFGGTHSVS